MQRLAAQREGRPGEQAVVAWRQLLTAAMVGPESEKLQKVNDFFNKRIHFQEDQESWGQLDYWATPLETLIRGQGDCEDFTIAKYMTLKLLGIPLEKLRLTYVTARIGGSSSRVARAHMVLSYYATPASEPMILDNLISDILPAPLRKDLHPVFSFNAEGLWVSGTRAVADPSARLSRWRDMLNRMRKEGLE